MRYCKRPWLNDDEQKLLSKNVNFKVSDESVNKMNDDLIANINAVVGEDDVLWVLGDWCFGTRQFPGRLHELKGKISCKTCHLIFGNHDFRKVVSPFFTTSHEKLTIAIADDGTYWMGEDEIGDSKESKRAQKIVLDHYPNASWNGSGKGWWMLHGHCHNNITPWTTQHMPNAKILDVGVDGHQYKPWSFEEIKRFMAHRPGFSADHHNAV